jgi:hypothetical protein
MTPGLRIAAPVLAALLIVTAMAGCTPTAKPTPKPTASASATALSPGITDITDPPGTGEGLAGALKDTTVTACAQKGTGWSVTGTVTNPTADAANYRIYVSLLNAANDTRALKQVDVDALAPAAKADWSADIPVDEKNLSCVLRVERYVAVAASPTPTKKP